MADVRKRLRRWAFSAGYIRSELDAATDRVYALIAHELAEKIRNTPSPRDPDDYGGLVDMGADWAADLIDPKKESDAQADH